MVVDAQQLSGIKQDVEQGQYGIDPVAVADAVLARLRGLTRTSSGEVGAVELTLGREHAV